MSIPCARCLRGVSAYCMKFSSSLLPALIGGAFSWGFLLPPLMAQPPANIVPRTPMASCVCSESANLFLHLYISSNRCCRKVRAGASWAGATYDVRADLLAEDLVVDDHFCDNLVVC